MKRNLLICLFSGLNMTGFSQYAGDLDSTFSLDGFTTNYVSPNGIFTDVAIQPYGRIVCTGRNNSNETVTIRYNSNGTTDNTFGSSGILVKNFGGVWTRFNE